MIEEFNGEYRWLSNFTLSNVTLDGIVYPSVENAYQAAKTTDFGHRVPFTHLTSGEAKRLGRKVPIRSDWDDVKLSVMEDLTRQKYSVDQFKALLLDTGDQEIIEGNYWNDTFWGVCRGEGQNNLGKIIMKIRDELKSEL